MRLQQWAVLPEDVDVGIKLADPKDVEALEKENLVLKNTILAFMQELQKLEARVEALENDNK